ncbi:TPA: phage tail protein [Klebsiella michiganensis]|nr:phage tail protein [Klebsiella michiganensis]
MTPAESQLDSLTRFIRENTPPRTQTYFEAVQDSGTLIRSFKDMGLGQYRLGIARYTVTLDWASLPYRLYSPVLLYAAVLAWLEQFRDPLFDELELPDPTFDVVFDNEQSCSDVLITLELADAITIIRDPAGDILLNGERWMLQTPDIFTAEEFGLDVEVTE